MIENNPDPYAHLIGTGWHPNEDFKSIRENGREVYREVVHHFDRTVPTVGSKKP